MTSILFLCVYNACRSQIAEAIGRTLAPPAWVIASAGLTPSDRVDPKAAAVLRSHGLEIGSPKPKGPQDLPTIHWDYAVSIGCGDAPVSVAATRRLRWEIPDPLDGPMELYHALYKDLEQRILELTRTIQHQGGR